MKKSVIFFPAGLPFLGKAGVVIEGNYLKMLIYY
jgi:hypothetical protein